jgi:glycosyltransferase involved in cell wall biosynthesis
MQKQILFIITGIKRGGLETYLLRFLKLKKNKIKPIILIQKLDKDYAFYTDFVKLGAKIIYLPIKSSPLSLFKFYSFLKREKINSICDFRGDFSGISLTISWLANVKKRIVFYRESVNQFKPNIFKLFYMKMINRLTKLFSTKILSNSQEAFNFFYKNSSLNKKCHKVIKNGVYKKKKIKNIDIKRMLGIPDNAFIIGHVGRYTHAKNHDLIIEIANILCKKYDDIYFLLCGSGVSEAITPKLIKYNLLKKVIMPGLCDNIPSYLNKMNIFLFPSYNEGQPNALIEAMNQGVPIVASNIPAILETVPTDMINVLFDPSDIQSFVSEIIKNKEINPSYNSKKVEKWSKIIYNQKDRFEEFYKELI